MIGYCIVSSGNGMVCGSKIFEFFLTKRAIFIFPFQFFPDPEARKHPNSFDNKLLTNF